MEYTKNQETLQAPNIIEEILSLTEELGTQNNNIKYPKELVENIWNYMEDDQN